MWSGLCMTDTFSCTQGCHIPPSAVADSTICQHEQFLSLTLLANNCRASCYGLFTRAPRSLRNASTAWDLFKKSAMNATSCTTTMALMFLFFDCLFWSSNPHFSSHLHRAFFTHRLGKTLLKQNNNASLKM